MKSEQKHFIKINNIDNVGVVIVPEGIQAGEQIDYNLKSAEFIPYGHKIALHDIRKGSPVVRYGENIAFALDNIKQGEWVNENKISLPAPPSLEELNTNVSNPSLPASNTEYSFMGYRNDDGSVGTKNILAISNSVQCVAGLTEHVVKKIKTELLPKYPNVDDVIGLSHSYGCGIAINAPAAIIPIRTIQNIARNPNFGNEVMVLGLGCEKLRPERIIEHQKGDADIFYMQDPAYQGFEAMVKGAMEIAEKHLKKLNERQRVSCPASELVVGMQCGGSDAFSGITANPVAGLAADLIVKAGGSVMFSEVTEVRDAIHLLVPRATNEKVAKDLIREMKWYDEYLAQGQVDRSENTAPGNKSGGLSTIVEKSLGSVVKSGSSPIMGVVPPGEKLSGKGLHFAATPAGDFVCGTLQLAAGMNVHLFMTGRGTPYGLSAVPVIKISSNTTLAKRWFDLIDFDAGRIISENKTIEELGWELFHLILDVASGNKVVASDKLELYNDLVLFNPGPLT